MSASSRRVYLTPNRLEIIETIARVEAGRPLVVFERSLSRPWAYVDFMCNSFMNVPLDDLKKKKFIGTFNVEPGTTHVNTELGCINVANYIVRGEKPCSRALDWDSIPDEKIYEYLIWHEVAHVIYRDVDFNTEFSVLGKHKEKISPIMERLIVRGQEYRADLWAWNKMFPGIEPPMTGVISCEEMEISAAALATFESKYDHKPCVPVGISTCKQDYIYFKYIESGIPFAGPAIALNKHKSN